MAPDRDIDDAIDRAVRDFMSAEPRPGFRARVLERLARRPSTWFALPRVAAAAALLVILVAAVQMARHARPLTPPPTPTESTAEARPEAPAGRALEAPPADVRPAPAPASGSASRAESPAAPPRRTPAPPDTPPSSAGPQFPPRGAVAAATLVGASSAPSATIDGMPVPLAPDAEPLVIEPLTIAPLAIEPLVVAPLSRRGDPPATGA